TGGQAAAPLQTAEAGQAGFGRRAIPEGQAAAASEPSAGGQAAAPGHAPAAAPAAGRRTADEQLWDTRLRNVPAVAGRDLGALLAWPVLSLGAAVVALGASLRGYLPQLAAGGPVTMAPVFGAVALGSALLVPLLTMRLLADQRRDGTLELL